MALTELTENLNMIQSLSDQPAIVGDELKAEFDKASNLIKEYINETLLPEINTLVSNLQNKDATLDSKINTVKTTVEENATLLTTKQLNLIYPVGAIYMSTSSTNPKNLFGGTWTQIKDRFLLATGDTYKNGATGGTATHTLTTAEMPKHTHTFTGVAHSHGLNSHTHAYTKANTTTGSTALTINQIPSHSHKTEWGQTNREATGYGLVSNGGFLNRVVAYLDDISNRRQYTSNSGGGQGHTHTIGTSSTKTGSSSGNTASATATGSNSNTGSGSAHNNMPPYYTVYMWRRTA